MVLVRMATSSATATNKMRKEGGTMSDINTKIGK
jgi:hypothetical protein